MLLSQAVSRCWAEIDLSALIANYHTALSLLQGGARLCCVVKANAYGLGAKIVAQTLYKEGARFFAAACLSEALEVKHAVPDADVLILGRTGRDDARSAIQNGLLLTVYSPASAENVIACALDLNLSARVHVKAETGLHRLGFSWEDREAIRKLADCPHIRIEGLYTHLALRDKENDRKQFEALARFDSYLKEIGVGDYLLHACDSIGMVRYPEKHFDLVRTGAWLYGVCPYRYEHPEKCLPTLTLKTRIAMLQKVPAGECIGYDETHPLARDSVIATLSAGYVDGFFRFNNKGEVLINGRRAPVLGLVCMDQMMVDVTDIPSAEEGDEVLLLGGGITVDEYAALAGLNRNEALCRTGRRVPRVYLKNGEAVACETD